MKATWFEDRELITLYTDPAYFGADVPESFMQRPCKPVPVAKLFGYEPESKMDDIHHKNDVLELALKMRTGRYDGPPIVCRKHPKGIQVLDGHHRMQAAKRAGLDTLDAVIVDSEDIQYSDAVREQVEEGWSQKYKSSIDCSNPKGFSQKAHCASRKKKKSESIRESYEIEFVCVNPNFCDATEQKNQDKLFQALRSVPGIIVYKQDFDEHNSMAAIIKDEADTDAPKLIQKLSQQYKVAIDLENDVSQGMMNDIVSGRLEGLTDYYDTDYLSEASGYIPTAAQANDPRFKTALTVDVRPGEDQRNIEKLGLNLNMDLVNKTKPGKKRKKTLAESLMERYQMFKEEDLVEVEMSSSALRSWAKSELAQGVRAGFELELILPDTERLDDNDDYEADMDADEPIGTLDQIVDFYNGPYGESWDSEQRQTEEQFREKVIEDLMDYEMEVFQDEWNDEGYEKVREAMIDEELSDFRGDNMDEIAQDAFDKDYDDLSANEEAYVDQKIMERFEEEIKNEFENQGDTYNRLYDEAMEESRGNITWNQFWEAQQIETMGDLMNVYDLYFPYTEGGGGGSKELSEWAQEITDITGKDTVLSYQYHGEEKQAGKYTIEPDSSLRADEDNDSPIELVSPVMPLDEAVEQLERLILWAEDNAYTNDSTGLHMNISVPQGNEIDYTKLVLFSGDKYILKQYERLGNSYADSALGQLEARAGQMDASRAAEAMQKMKTNLEDAAEEYVRAGTGQAKYTSIHIKDGYIEFRGPGGQYTAQEVDQVMDTMLRFARAMTIAADPQAYRQEYQKKLYKILSKGGKEERTIDSLFADFQAGNINKEIFKKRWANLVVQQQQDQAILNKLDGVPDDKRTQKARAIQQSTAGKPKPFTYNLPIEDAQGNRNGLKGKVVAASAQLAKQAAVDDALEKLKDPNLSQFKPRFSELKVEIDLPSPAQPQVADVENKEVAYMVSIPYEVDGDTGEHSVIISAQSPEEAKQEAIRRARRRGFPSSWNFNYAGTTAEET